jgi:hypothetical protein
MLAEMIQHWRTPAPAWVKTMGYVRESIALDHRHRRCQAGWAPHLDACKDLIRRAGEGLQSYERCVVLGSGHLLDIPLTDLAARFRRVELVDLVHPLAVRARTRGLDNVHLVEADISGAARAVFDLAEGPAPEPVPDGALVQGADLVISANLLSPLPLLLLDRLESHAPWVGAGDRLAFARSAVDHHLALLQHQTGRVCLISEVLRLFHDNERPLDKADPLFGAAILYEGEEWWWDIAPRPELAKDYDVRLRVLGIPDLAAAPQARYCRNTTLAAP